MAGLGGYRPRSYAWRTLAPVSREHEQERATAERAFAILTAKYHGLPELAGLIDELTLAEARLVILALASFVEGMLKGAEIVSHTPFGSALPRAIGIVRRRAPWL